MNPRPKRRRKTARKRRSKNPVKRNSKGRFVKRAHNPRKKHRRKNARRHHVKYRRKRRAVAVSNPRRRHRRRSNPRHHYRKRRRNPIGLPSKADLMGHLMPAAIGGAGAVLNSVLLGYLTPIVAGILPPLTTGYGLHALRIGSSLGLGILGKKFGGKNGEIAGAGALTVAMYLLFRDVVVAFAPTMPLGDYEEISIDDTGNIGAYMSGAYLPDGSRIPSKLGAYMDPASRLGAYMSGDAGDQGWNYAGESDGYTLNGLGTDGMDY
jgi:hypothetical protein